MPNIHYARVSSPHDRECVQAHARQRAWERYGVTLTTADLDAIVAAVESGSPYVVKLRPTSREHPFRSWVAARVNGRWMSCVYDDAAKIIVTFLDPDGLDRWQWVIERATAVINKRERALAPEPEPLAEWVPEPEVEPEPEAAPPPYTGPPVGTVLGRVEGVTLSYRAYSRINGAPMSPPSKVTLEDRVPTDCRTIGEAVDRIATLKAELTAIQAVFPTIRDPHERHRLTNTSRSYAAERKWLGLAVLESGKRMKRRFSEMSDVELAGDDPFDPVNMLRVAVATIVDLLLTHDYPPDDRHFVVVNAIREHLHRATPLNVERETTTETETTREEN